MRRGVVMCRWLGYLGSPIEPRELLYDPERSLIEQSRRHAPDMAVPNGDGFGLGWYGRREVPAIFHSATPAWGDRNLHTLA
jgi:predicted glutamine amidotransferase